MPTPTRTRARGRATATWVSLEHGLMRPASRTSAVAAVHPQFVFNRPHFDASDPGGRPVRGNPDGLVEVARLDEEEPANLFLGFREGSVRDRHLAVANAHGRCGGRALKGVGDDQAPAAAQALDVVEGFLPQRLPLDP